MKTLKDYDLQRGDWVKLTDYGWGEFRKYNPKKDNLRFFASFCEHGWMSDDDKVEVVLRPPFIIRDLLPKEGTPLLGTHFVSAICSGKKNNDYYYDLEFQIIQPKEENKSLDSYLYEALQTTDPAKSAELRAVAFLIASEIKEMRVEIDKLKEERK